MGEAADVVVVGASPAGLAAALAAARAGASVVLLEAKDEIGLPEPPAALAFDFLWAASERPPPTCVRRRLQGVRLRSPYEDTHSLTVEAPLSIIDRTRFDRHLAELARQAGVDVRAGVKDLAARADRTLTAGGDTWRGKVVVFADGAGSLARAYMRPTRDPDAVAWGVALAFVRPGAADEEFVTLTPGSHAPGGRMQLNPLDGDGWSHWTFVRGPREYAVQQARVALALEARLRRWPERLAETATVTAVAPDPVLALPGDLVADGVMAAGGAAGQGGLEVGVASGEMAGVVAAKAALAGDASVGALRPYEHAWRREYAPGYRALRRANGRLARLSDAQIDRLLEPWAGWRVPVRDVVGLAHRSPARRAEALAKFVARNPWAAPTAALLGLRALVPIKSA